MGTGNYGGIMGTLFRFLHLESHQNMISKYRNAKSVPTPTEFLQRYMYDATEIIMMQDSAVEEAEAVKQKSVRVKMPGQIYLVIMLAFIRGTALLYSSFHGLTSGIPTLETKGFIFLCAGVGLIAAAILMMKAKPLGRMLHVVSDSTIVCLIMYFVDWDIGLNMEVLIIYGLFALAMLILIYTIKVKPYFYPEEIEADAK